MSYRIWKLLRKKGKYSFYFIIHKDPNHPELQETRVNRIKDAAENLDLVPHIFEDEDMDIVTIWVETTKPFKKITFKLYIGDLLGDFEFFKGYEINPTGN